MDSKIDKILKKFGSDLKYEDLNYEERETVDKMLNSVSAKPLTIDDFKEYIRKLITAVENELIDTDEYIYTFIFKRVNRKHVYLKARLKNLIFIESFLYSKDRAKSAMERYLNNTRANAKK